MKLDSLQCQSGDFLLRVVVVVVAVTAAAAAAVAATAAEAEAMETQPIWTKIPSDADIGKDVKWNFIFILVFIHVGVLPASMPIYHGTHKGYRAWYAYVPGTHKG